MTLGERLKEIRISKNLTQVEFSQKLNITQATIAIYENNTKKPSERLVIDICDKFNINREWLEFGTGERDRVLPRTEAIEKFFIENIKNRSESMTNLIKAISKLNDKDLEKIKELANILLDENKDINSNTDI